MNHTCKIFLASFFLVVLSVSVANAADPDTAVTRLRESLRNTMLQLRTAQTDLATAQAGQAEAEEKNKTLTAQVGDLTIKAQADSDALNKQISEMDAKLENGEAETARLNTALEKWKDGYQKVVDAANKVEAARAKLESEKAVLLRRVDDQQTRNVAMYKLGTEILNRYEKFGIGAALTAREPFVGVTRVKFENLIQDYSDKLAEQKIKP